MFIYGKSEHEWRFSKLGCADTLKDWVVGEIDFNKLKEKEKVTLEVSGYLFLSRISFIIDMDRTNVLGPSMDNGHIVNEGIANSKIIAKNYLREKNLTDLLD